MLNCSGAWPCKTLLQIKNSNKIVICKGFPLKKAGDQVIKNWGLSGGKKDVFTIILMKKQ